MKNIFNHTVVIVLGLSMTACFSELELSPKDYLYPDNYYQDSAQIATALVGCYDALTGGNCYSGSVDGFLGNWNVVDGLYNAAAGTGPKVYNYTSSYPQVNTMWTGCYDGIQRCCQLLKYIDQANASDAVRNVIRGEAMTLRAFWYLTLVQNWGPVPLITDATEDVNKSYFPQSTEEEIYDWIINELTQAESMVKDITAYGHSGRINKSAVRALAARACLAKAGYPCYDTSKYAEAYAWAKKVINSGLHELNKSYAQVFINPIQDLYDIKESIWEIELYHKAKADSYTEYYPSMYVTMAVTQSNASFPRSSTTYKVRKHLFDMYETEAGKAGGAKLGSPDCRRNWAIGPYAYATIASNNLLSTLTLSMSYFETATTDVDIYSRFPNKFNRQYEKTTLDQIFQSNTAGNIILVRYSDVLLMAAEASNEVNGPTAEAIGWINYVRQRGYGNLSGGSRIDHIEVTNGGAGYSAGQVYVTVGNSTSSSTTTTTSNVVKAVVYNTGDVKGAPVVAPATVAANGTISEIQLWDRGDMFTTVPTVTIQSLDKKGSGATAIAVLGKTFDHILTAGATATKDAFRKTIQDERQRELCFEGQRRLDLKRWGIYVDVMRETYSEGLNSTLVTTTMDYVTLAGKNIGDSYNYLPIPAMEMQVNKALVQNPGW
ncbi:MAG: RagB/SusD family nutrient uptake outer membrane protein [Mangrovibacterium sp.]